MEGASVCAANLFNIEHLQSALDNHVDTQEGKLSRENQGIWVIVGSFLIGISDPEFYKKREF